MPPSHRTDAPSFTVFFLADPGGAASPVSRKKADRQSRRGTELPNKCASVNRPARRHSLYYQAAGRSGWAAARYTSPRETRDHT